MVVLVGFGRQMETEYLPSLRNLGIEIAAVCEPDIIRRNASNDDGLSTFRSIDDLPASMCSFPALVAVPHHLTPTVLRGLLDMGFNKILIEKPPALSLDEFGAVHEQIESTGAKVYIAAKRRYRRTYIALRSLLDAGEQANSISIRLHRCFQKSSFGWRSDPDKAGCGVLYDLGYHAIDLALWLSRFPSDLAIEKVSRSHGCRSTSISRRTNISLHLPSCEIRAHIDVDRLAPSPFEQIVVDYPDRQIIVQPHAMWEFSKRGAPPRETILELAGQIPATLAMLNDFFSNETTALSIYAQHVHHLRLIDLAIKSAQ